MSKDPFTALDDVSKLFRGQDGGVKALIDQITGSHHLGALRGSLDAMHGYPDMTQLSAAIGGLNGPRDLAIAASGALSRTELALAAYDSPYLSALDRVAGLGMPATINSLDYGVASSRATDLALGVSRGGAYELAMRSAGVLADRFRMPGIDEITRLARGIYAPLEERYGLTGAALQSSLQAMHNPWLHTADAAASFAGIARLHGIGHLVSADLPFGRRVADVLRVDLGDWRDRISWPNDMATDLTVRAGLYLDRGFNPALTAFPAETFEEGMQAAGFQDGRPMLVVAYGDPVLPSDDEEAEVAFERNNAVHDWLQRFETQIRHFIDAAMTVAFGPDWPRHQLPNGLYDEWLAKQAKDDYERIWPLIYYADFTDYERVICKKDNWRAIFAQRFKRPELVRESLQRIYPARIATMHARPLMPEDELFVFAEIKRLVRLFAL